MLKQFLKNINEDMNKRDWLILIIIIVSAILFRLIFMAKSYAIGFDQVNYLKLAASGNIYGLNHVLHAYWPPLYPLAVALFSYIVTDFELAGRLLSILCASLIIIPIFFFVKTNFNKRVAFGTSLLIAFYSFSAYFSAKAEAEFIYSIVGIVGIILGWIVLKNKKIGKAFIVGILFGLAYLARPEGIGFLITYWGVIFIILISQLLVKQKITNYIYILLLSGFGFGLVSFPYLLYLHQETGVWTLSTKGASNQQGAMYVENKEKFDVHPFRSLSEDNKRLFEDEIYHRGTFLKTLRKEGAPVVKISITALAKKAFENFYKLLTEAFTKVLPLPLVILIGLGLFVKPWIREKALLNLYLLSYIIFFWFMVIPLFHITLRYFVPLLPISFIWIANGADNFIEWLSATLKNSIEKWPSSISVRLISLVTVILIILCSSILPEFGKRMMKNINSVQEWAPCIEQKKAGLWLKKNCKKSPVVMAHNHAVSFYAGNYNITESVEIPVNKIDRILKYAKYRNVDYIVLNERYQENFPLIKHLYEQKDVPENLKLIYIDDEKTGLKTLIYEILN